jgi:hypothetical protein
MPTKLIHTIRTTYSRSEYRPISHSFVKMTPSHQREWPSWRSLSKIQWEPERPERSCTPFKYIPLFPRKNWFLIQRKTNDQKSSTTRSTASTHLLKEELKSFLIQENQVNQKNVKLLLNSLLVSEDKDRYSKLGFLFCFLMSRKEMTMLDDVMQAYTESILLKKDHLDEETKRLSLLPFQMILKRAAYQGQVEFCEKGKTFFLKKNQKCNPSIL